MAGLLIPSRTPQASAPAPVKAGPSAASTDGRGSDHERHAAKTFLRRIVVWVGLFSIFVNVLMLTGPLFMLQVYDRVLSSGSLPTLTALFALVAVLFLFMGILDLLRNRLLARAGAQLESLFETRLFQAALSTAGDAKATGLRAVETIRQFFTSPAPLALFDLPWSPLFFALIFLFHWSLGLLALGAGLTLMILALINGLLSRRLLASAHRSRTEALSLEQGFRSQGETVQALGMVSAAAAKLGRVRAEARRRFIAGHDRTSGFTTAVRTLRLFFQSAILALGAALAIGDQITPGMMIAASILMGRALAPIDQAVAQWPLLMRSLQSWRDLRNGLDASANDGADRVRLPRPEGLVEVTGLAVTPPGAGMPAVQGVTFNLHPGEALGVVGRSASGKSTLARALVGVWPAGAGELRLDGAALDQYDPDQLGSWIGYLPQDVALFDGTVGDNIARFGTLDHEAVIAAARMADAHDMILRLPAGYGTPVGERGQALSGGQRQRIALARALYRQPPLLVLDEPNAHLDLAGEASLVTAVERAKAVGQSVIVIAHRPSAIAVCDRLLVLQDGRKVDLGPREEVLGRSVRNGEGVRRRLQLVGRRR